MTSDPNKLSHLLACGAPQLESEVVARGADDNPTTAAVRDFAAGPLTFCLLLGGAGSGKTVAAVEALLNSKMYFMGGRPDVPRSWVYCPSEARFYLASDLARLSYFDAPSQKKLGRAERVPWLVLDDVGGELVTDTWRSNFTEIILRRNSARLKTLITSNLSGDEFKARYDDRVISRIRGNGIIVTSGKTDLRRAP
jgi:DNA replication protein DnaC